MNLTGQRGQTFGMALNSAKIPGTTQNISSTSLLGTPNITLSPILTCDPRSNLGAESVHQPELLQLPDADRPERPDHAAGDLRAGVFQYGPRPLQELQDRREEELPIAHERVQLPESSAVEFNGGNLNLGFAGATGVLNTPLFGTVTTKQGHRVVQLAATFTF